MKILALFLSVIVMALTVMPCCAWEGRDGHSYETPQIDNYQCNEKNDNCCKSCSPFYACCAGSGFTFTRQAAVTFTVLSKPVQHNTAYMLSKVSVIPIAIWQPPKLS